MAEAEEKSEPMKYGMLGFDDRSEEEKLEQFSGEVAWTYLKPHLEVGVLFYLDKKLHFKEVGQAITEDQTDKVQDWLASGELTKLEPIHAKQWEETSETLFEAMVVSPFVLCRLKD